MKRYFQNKIFINFRLNLRKIAFLPTNSDFLAVELRSASEMREDYKGGEKNKQ